MKTGALFDLFLGFFVGIICGVLLMKIVYADSISKWDEVTYKYSYCPYCGEELGIGFDEK